MSSIRAEQNKAPSQTSQARVVQPPDAPSERVGEVPCAKADHHVPVGNTTSSLADDGSLSVRPRDDLRARIVFVLPEAAGAFASVKTGAVEMHADSSEAADSSRGIESVMHERYAWRHGFSMF